MNTTKRIDYNSLLGTMAREANGMPHYSSENISYHEFYINGHFVQCVFEYNRYYGEILRQWAIDGNDRTTVNCKYQNFEKGSLLCDCSNGSIGSRDFEKDSIVYEFFIKPLGLVAEKFEHNEYIDKISYRITPYNLKRYLYGENYLQQSSTLGWDHPSTKLQKTKITI